MANESLGGRPRSAGTLRGMVWWIDRWRQSSAFTEMTVEEQGAYRNLLDEAWLRGGGIPNDPQLLARASGDPVRWKHIRDRVLRWFVLDGDTWHNVTLTKMQHQARRRAINQQSYRDRK